jgi:hypothetical protein
MIRVANFASRRSIFVLPGPDEMLPHFYGAHDETQLSLEKTALMFRVKKGCWRGQATKALL